MIVNGTIQIDSDRKTITLKLENGSFCLDHFPNGIKHFLEDELDCLRNEPSDDLIRS